MRRLLTEPLVQFMALGAMLFALYEVAPAIRTPQENRILVTSSVIQGLSANFARAWQRPPTSEELDGLVEDYIRGEVFYRAGSELGLHRDDSIVKSRIRQKMELLATDAASLSAPTDVELQAYLDAHPDRFAAEPRISFRQVFLSPQRRGDALLPDARRLRDDLNRSDSVLPGEEVGDPTLLPTTMEQATPSEIEAVLGAAFARELSNLDSGQWHGPVRSTYGMHLVRISELTPAKSPRLADVRQAVEREWSSARRQQIADALYQQLLACYTLVIEYPERAENQPPTTQTTPF